MKAKNMKQWHDLVTKRDGYVCQVCRKDFSYPMYFDGNGRNQYVCGHHVKSKKAYPGLKLETENGQTICFHCHAETHN